MDSVHAWLLLRKPFPLTRRCVSTHACEWERIDVDKTGCVLCSNIHVCSFGQCKQVTLTEDSLVCDITGLCIRQDNIIVTGFSDEVISYGSSETYTCDNKRLEQYDCIDAFVCELLLSETASRVHGIERKHYLSKLTISIQKTINKHTAPRGMLSVLALIEDAVSHNTDRKGYSVFDHAGRQRVAESCVKQLRSTLPICNKFLKMNIKRTDMRSAVFGLLFLMRSGIHIHDICVLPSIPELLEFLPNESNLLKYFGFKSKTITEIENKFK